MSRDRIVCPLCLLGIGYTSIIASQLLKQRGYDSLIVGIASHKPAFELQVSDRLISVLPMFPLKDSELYQTLNLGRLFPESIIRVEYSGLGKFDLDDYHYAPSSLANFLKQHSLLAWLQLSIKQWGPSIFVKPFSEVQKKISRHYLSSKNTSRVGYFDGLSLYHHFIQQANPNILLIDSIERIDFENRIMITDRLNIHYKKLISTIPIDRLLSISGYGRSVSLDYEGSYFLYFSHSIPFKENSILYDCDLESDIFRVFSPTENIVSIQIPAYRRDRLEMASVAKRLGELIPNLGNPHYEKSVFFSMSYPLESLSDEKTLRELEWLKANSVLPFGRLGNWEYSDLHELNWASIFDGV